MSFQGDKTCLHWANRDLAALQVAIGQTVGREVVVQAGGNLGVFAAELSKTFKAVYTFEPSPDLFPLLVANAPQSNIVRFQAALGDEPAMISVALPADTSHAGEHHVAGEGIIPTMRLDDLNLPACDLLYLDIEGFELFALKGAEQTIKRHRPAIALEMNKCSARYGYGREDLFALMKDWGYIESRNIHADHIFVHKDSLETVKTLNLVAVRVGDKYGPEYVQILFNMLVRNLTVYEGPIKLWCITDSPADLPPHVTAIQTDPAFPGYWAKVQMFGPHMPFGPGERVAYFDLDVAITGALEDLVETPGILQDELWPCYNSSVMVWRHGEHREIWDKWAPYLIDEPSRLVPKECLPVGTINAGDQEHITEVSSWETFPVEWCPSYKLHAREWPPANSKVVIFNGEPKPDSCDGWVKDVWKLGGLTSLPHMDGVNVEVQTIYDNIAASAVRDLPWFRAAFPHDRTAVLVCGGPSLLDDLDTIRQHKKRGAKVFTVNNTLKTMLAHNIMPDAHIMLDARPENVDFLVDADTRYFIAGQCDPCVFDRLKDQAVTVWHSGCGDGNRLEAIVKPYEDAEADRILTAIPGGGTIGLRAMWLAYFSGYRKLRIYGMDGSYEGDKHHAYDQSLNDGEDTLSVIMNGKPYRCAAWMARQACEFESAYRDLTNLGMTIFVGGRGIIPDMAALLRTQLREKEAA